MANAQRNGAGFVNIRPCLNRVVEVMELFYGQSIRCPSWKPVGPWPEDDGQRVGEDLTYLEYSPQKAVLIDQAHIIWQQVIRRKIPAVWFIRAHRPVTVVMSAVLYQADVPIAHVLNGKMTDREFDRMTLEVGRLAGSPLKIYAAGEPDSFPKALSSIAPESVSFIISDWVLTQQESALAERLTRHQNILFLCPR